MLLSSTYEFEEYPIPCLQLMLIIYVAAQAQDVKEIGTEWARKLLSNIIISIEFFKPHKHICIHTIPSH